MPWQGGGGGTLSASTARLHITILDPELQGTPFSFSFLTYCCTQGTADRRLAITGPLEIGLSVRTSIMQVRWAAAAQQPPWRWDQLAQPTGSAARAADIRRSYSCG